MTDEGHQPGALDIDDELRELVGRYRQLEGISEPARLDLDLVEHYEDFFQIHLPEDLLAIMASSSEFLTDPPYDSDGHQIACGFRLGMLPKYNRDLYEGGEELDDERAAELEYVAVGVQFDPEEWPEDPPYLCLLRGDLGEDGTVLYMIEADSDGAKPFQDVLLKEWLVRQLEALEAEMPVEEPIPEELDEIDEIDEIDDFEPDFADEEEEVDFDDLDLEISDVTQVEEEEEDEEEKFVPILFRPKEVPVPSRRVRHAKFGEGSVEKVEGDKVSVLFDDGTRKKFLSQFLEFIDD